MYYIVRMSKKVEWKKNDAKNMHLALERKISFVTLYTILFGTIILLIFNKQVFLAIRGGYIPNKIRTVNTQTHILSLN